MLRALICLGALVTPFSAYALTGAQLKILCSGTDVVSRNECKAYVRGAADGVYNTIEAIGGTTGPRVGQYFCLPPKATSKSLVNAVRTYMNKTPEARNYNASTVVALGLGKSYPCRGDD
jgi:hypothetical protein